MFLVKFVTFVQLHPDLNPGDPSSHTKFVRLSEAYSVLNDVTLRREYDLRFVRSTRPRQHSQSCNIDSRFSQHSCDRLKTQSICPHMQSSFNRPIFPVLLHVKMVSKSKLLGIVVAVPDALTSLNQQHQITEG